MFGVLVDVSGSMQSAYSEAQDELQSSIGVERVRAVLTTIVNIVSKEVSRHRREESIFVSAFGLRKALKSQTCDFLTLLDYVSSPAGRAAVLELDDDLEHEQHAEDYQALVDFANEHGYNNLERLIKTYLTPLQAKLLHKGLSSDEKLVQELSRLIDASKPKFIAALAAQAVLVGTSSLSGSVMLAGPYDYRPSRITKYVENRMVYKSDAYCYAKKIIHTQKVEDIMDQLGDSLYQLTPRKVQNVADMMEHLLQRSLSAFSYSNDNILKIIESIEPCIFGLTPMCKALREAEVVFKTAVADKKVLFILSDGMSTDGDPLPIAQRLRSAGVTIATCYFTSDMIQNPKRLLDPRHCTKFKHNSGQQLLMKMSSTMKNTHTPVSYLIDMNWELPPSGESSLFVQANSLDVVNEFCKHIVSNLTNKNSDAIIDMIGRVNLGRYINQQNAKFEPKSQIGGTCYANATATVLHLAMNRIVGREGGIPRFEDICKRIIDEYGLQGANIENVLETVCPEYRLHFCEVSEIDARKALNKRRPVVATFYLYQLEWTKFSQFYRRTPRQILQKSDLKTICVEERNPGGHAVVLTSCDSACLTFMNSWSTEFADGGFFRVKDQSVLNSTKFYDVYWTEKDLKPSEKAAFRRHQLGQTFPSI